MNKDTYLLEHPNLLLEKKIYLCGAGYDGRYTLKLLRMQEIYPVAFADSAEVKVGTEIDGLTVLSFDEIAEKSKVDNDMLLVVSSAAQTASIIDSLTNAGVECQDIYSLFALFFSVYFHRHSIFNGREDLGKKCTVFFDLWKNKKANLQAVGQGDLAYKCMLELMMSNNTPVLIDQPGKVGSHTIKYTLESEKIDYIHFHGFSYSLDIDCPENKKWLRAYLRELPKIKIITLIREPISKDFGHFFQKISIAERDFIWLCKGLMEDNLEKSFFNYLSVVTPLDFTDEGRDKFTKQSYCHIDYIGQSNPYGANWGFFEDEFKGFWGVDLLDYDFDITKGYSVIHQDNLEILVLRLDKLNTLEDELGKFLELETPLKLVNGNIAEKKDYGRAYKELMQEIVLPKAYVDYYYDNNKYTNHFFSADEREAFRKKWLR